MRTVWRGRSVCVLLSPACSKPPSRASRPARRPAARWRVRSSASLASKKSKVNSTTHWSSSTALRAPVGGCEPKTTLPAAHRPHSRPVRIGPAPLPPRRRPCCRPLRPTTSLRPHSDPIRTPRSLYALFHRRQPSTPPPSPAPLPHAPCPALVLVLILVPLVRGRAPERVSSAPRRPIALQRWTLPLPRLRRASWRAASRRPAMPASGAHPPTAATTLLALPPRAALLPRLSTSPLPPRLRLLRTPDDRAAKAEVQCVSDSLASTRRATAAVSRTWRTRSVTPSRRRRKHTFRTRLRLCRRRRVRADAVVARLAAANGSTRPRWCRRRSSRW
mmetsp:Transcript_7000/g.21321  ORF Transcript_7000/g.21321 Transcript_7000/m.21321 type:complete len:332 (+) Transcript_7000:159-1154(+)